MGAMIKASKLLHAKNGKLVISRPSTFCRDIIEKVGLDRVVTVYDSDQDDQEKQERTRDLASCTELPGAGEGRAGLPDGEKQRHGGLLQHAQAASGSGLYGGRASSDSISISRA